MLITPFPFPLSPNSLVNSKTLSIPLPLASHGHAPRRHSPTEQIPGSAGAGWAGNTQPERMSPAAHPQRTWVRQSDRADWMLIHDHVTLDFVVYNDVEARI